MKCHGEIHHNLPGIHFPTGCVKRRLGERGEGGGGGGGDMSPIIQFTYGGNNIYGVS